jgi:hypothetical protein
MHSSLVAPSPSEAVYRLEREMQSKGRTKVRSCISRHSEGCILRLVRLAIDWGVICRDRHCVVSPQKQRT